jgi:opacity protein-like surface antigen
MIGPRQFLLGGIAAFAFSGAALAADVPVKGPAYKAPPAAWSWEGQYIGIHGGYAWANNDVNVAGVASEFSPSSGFGGFQIGYNHHLSARWILGYEIDVSFANFNETRLIGANVTPFEIDAFGTARTRLGYVQGPWLLYATGGLAWATTKIEGINGGANRFERPHVGYVVGAGVEYAFAPNWSAKLEYLYADLGDTNTTVAGVIINNDLTISSVRLGLNYRFANWQGPVAPAYPVKAPVVAAGWTGSYIGVHGGYAWGSFDAVAGAVAESLDPKGGFGGFQTGYNWQLSRNWVIGLESDSSWGSINQTVGATNVDIDAMGTVRARIGYAMNNILFYGTGGLAWAHADSVTTAAVRDQFYLGWAAGAGIEYAFAPRWSAKVEYIYADYDNIGDVVGAGFSAKLDVSTIKLGINYRASILELIGFGR